MPDALAKGKSRYVLCFSLMLFISITCFAQTARITVRSPEDNLPSATIVITDLISGTVQTIITGKDGAAFYKLKGRSALTISHMGYMPAHDTLAIVSDKVYILKSAPNALQEVVIAGQYRPVSAEKSLYNVKVLDRERIRSRGAVSLGDLMMNELNARVMSDNVLGNTLILQGISGQNVKVLLDGVPVVGSAGDEFDLGLFNLNNTERVEIVEGPLSVQYGTNALAGTINIVSRDLDAGKFQAGINTYYESARQYNLDVNTGIRAGSYKLRLNLGRNQFTGYSSPGNRAGRPYDNRSLNWNPKEQYFGNFRISRMLGTINAGLMHNQLHEDNHSKGAPDPGTQLLTASDYDYISNRWNTVLYANGKLGDHSYIDFLNSYQYFNRDSRTYLTNVHDESRNFLGNSNTRFLSWIFRGSYSNSDAGKGHMGYQAGYEINLNNSTGDRVAESAGKINDAGIYGSWQIMLMNKLEIQPALRYAWNNKYDPKDINFLNSRLPVIPSLNVRFVPGPHLTFRASYAKGFRAPSLRELFYDFKNANHFIIGNEALLPEIADNYMVSARYQWAGGKSLFSISPFAYINLIDNKIELVQLDRSTLPPEWQNINVARTYANIPDFRTRGVTLSLGYSYDNNFRAQLGGGLLQRSGSNSLGRYFNSYEANTTLAYSVKKIGRFSLFYKYNGPLAQFSLKEDGSLSDKTLQACHLMDLSLTRGFDAGRYLFTAGIKNIFNVTDVLQTGEGSDSLVPRADSKTALPVAWGRSVFIKASYLISKQ